MITDQLEITGAGGLRLAFEAEETDQAPTLGQVQNLISAALSGDGSPLSFNTTQSVLASVVGTDVSFAVARKTAAMAADEGLLGTGANGLFVALGTGANVAAAGDHSHALATGVAHGFMSSTDKSKLDGLSALTLGTGASNAAAGNHGHTVATTEDPGFMSATMFDQLASAYSATSGGVVSESGAVAAVGAALNDSNSIELVFSSDQITATLHRKTASLAAGEGLIGVDVGGVFVALGSTAGTAAAGNHGHSNATISTAGFMSGTDKAKLDDLSAFTVGTGATDVAAGDHTHSSLDTLSIVNQLTVGSGGTFGLFGATPVSRQASADQSAVTLTSDEAAVTGIVMTNPDADALRAEVAKVCADVANINTLLAALRSSDITFGLIKGSA